jgi:hypothetical protein
VALAGLLSLYFSGLAMSKDKDDSDDESAKLASTLPNIYLDLRTNYATVPANARSIGFNNPSLFSALTTLRTLASLTDLTNLTTRPTLPTLSSPSSQSVGIDVPLTVDLNDHVSAYGGFSGTASRTSMSDWSAFTISSWNVGSGRFGVQSFGGAQLLNLTPFQPFTQPIVRIDLDRMDDNDNRLFGVTAQIAWVPKPSYQLTFRTPLYAARN